MLAAILKPTMANAILCLSLGYIISPFANDGAFFCKGLSIPNWQGAKSPRKTLTSLSLASSSPLFRNNRQAKSTTALFVATNVTSMNDATGISISKDEVTLSKNQEALSNRKFPRTWVPLASVFELDPDRPTPLEFLDQKFVCYKQTTNDDIQDDWIVMDDVCPHRLVPLSEGRINRVTDNATSTTTIQCSYHGWEFDGSQNGACTKIPQAIPELEAMAMASPQASVSTYSTIVHKNILWFWPWADTDPLSLLSVYPKGHPEGIMASIANLPPGEEGESIPNTYTRDLPYGWDTLLENLIDPAHIPFAHHGLQGTREDAIPIQMSVPHTLGSFETETTNARSGEAGFMFEWQDRTMKKHRAGTAEFQAPFGIAYDGKLYATKEEADVDWGTHCDKKRDMLNGKATISEPKTDDDDEEEKKDLGVFTLGVLCIPTKPGWSRAIILNGGKAKDKVSDEKTEELTESKTEELSPETAVAAVDTEAKASKKKKKKSMFAIIMGIIPTWAAHLLSNRFLDSDLAFLHYQEQERLRYEESHNTGSRSSSYYYMPAPSDRCISKLRQWIPKHTDYMGSSDAEGHSYTLPPPITDRKQLFDRYLQHTSHCKHCQKGLQFLRTKAKKYAWGGLVASVVASHYLGSRLLGLAAKLLAISCLGALGLISSLEKAFLVGEFKHYENH